MYTLNHFQVEDREMLTDFIKQNSFAIVFSKTEQGPMATHLPFVLDETVGEQGTLIGHLAKANPHWREMDGQEVLVVFAGPHAYISPTWYAEPNTVPTWNYVAVHVYGTFRAVGQERLLEILQESVQLFEEGMPMPWKLDGDNEYLNRMVNAIVGFEIEITRIEGKWKLNQNHPVERQQRVVENLKRSEEPKAREIAQLMEQNLNKK